MRMIISEKITVGYHTTAAPDVKLRDHSKFRLTLANLSEVWTQD